MLRGIGRRWGAALGDRAEWIKALPCDPNLGQASAPADAGAGTAAKGGSAKARPRRTRIGRPGTVRLGRTRFVPVEADGAPGEELEATREAGHAPTRGGWTSARHAPGAAGSPAAQRGGARGADAQAGRLAGALLRRALLGGVRPRSDARRARARGRDGVRLLGADLDRDRRADGRRRAVLPPDDPRLPARRRVVHRRLRQPRPAPRADRRRRADARLHPHRRRVGRLGDRRDHFGDSLAGARHRAAGAGGDRDPRRRQPARRAPGGAAVRGAHLHVHLRDPADGRCRARGRRRARLPRHAAPAGARRRGRGAAADPARVRLGRHGDDRDRGDLRRDPRASGRWSGATRAPPSPGW